MHYISSKKAAMQGITYIIATHNRHQLLKRAIDSIAVERFPNSEIPSELIVVDDCSHPPVVMQDEWHQHFEGGIRLIRNPTNQQVSRTRNIGLQNSSYDYVIFLDDDDISYPNRSLLLFNAIHNSPYSFVTAKSVMKSGSEEKTVPTGGEMELNPINYLSQFAHINAIIWKKDELLVVGGMDETNPYFGEHIAALKLLLSGKTALQLQETVTEFEYFEKGLTSETQQQNKFTNDLIKMYRLLNQHSPHHPAFQTICKKMLAQLPNLSPKSFDEYLLLLNKSVSP